MTTPEGTYVKKKKNQIEGGSSVWKKIKRGFGDEAIVDDMEVETNSKPLRALLTKGLYGGSIRQGRHLNEKTIGWEYFTKAHRNKITSIMCLYTVGQKREKK